MSLTNLLARPVTILRAGATVNRNNDSVPNWGAATSILTTGWLSQLSSIEDLDGRNGTATTFSLTLPVDTDITARDRVVIGGRTFELAAEPHRAWTPAGEHHVECELKVADG